jgi:hypothetical protein
MTEYVTKDGDFVIKVLEQDEDTIQFIPSGGGFVKRMRKDIFENNFTVLEKRTFKACYVTADFLETSSGKFEYIPCYSNGQRWNGWAIPFLEEKELLTLIDIIKQSSSDHLELIDNKFFFDPEEPGEFVEKTQIALDDGKLVSGYYLNISWVFELSDNIPTEELDPSDSTPKI